VAAAVRPRTRARLPQRSIAQLLPRSSPRTVKEADVADNADEAPLALLPAGQAARLRSKYTRAAKILDSYNPAHPAQR